MSNRVLTHDELPAAFAEQARVWREQWRAMMQGCAHCWHGTWHPPTALVAFHWHCCWCGDTSAEHQPRGRPHGPYAPEGDR